MKIYIAGPYSAKQSDFDGPTHNHDASRQAYQNTRNAIWAGIQVMRRGHTVFIPHLSHYIHQEMSVDDMGALPDYPLYWYHFDNEWLDVCDAVFLVAHSPGANAEVERAKQHGKTIYYSIKDIPPSVR